MEDTLLPDGRRLLGRLGGDAVYAAIGARVWCDDVVPVARLGKDFPPPLLERLRAAGYDEGLIPCQHNSIRLWVHWGAEGGRRFSFREDAGTYEELTVLPHEIPVPVMRGLTAVHIAPVPFQQMEMLIRWTRARARVLTVDPHYQHVDGNVEPWRRVLPLVDVFLPSRSEAADLLGEWPGPEAAARALTHLGPPIVVVKLGADGAVAYRARDATVVRVSAVESNPIDPTGSGDAFCGGFLVGFTETNDLQLALEYGAVSASFVAADYGAEHALAVDRVEARRRVEGLRS
ncbi:MAG: carbohydrate kinase family protein [Actinomycetota bacterium]|nr:carbohydrate kinase family protein [Actinomycetota bacterium]